MFCLFHSSVAIRLLLRSDPIGEEQKLECAWAPFSKSHQPLDWMVLTEHEAMFPHMQLRELKGEDSMPTFLSAVKSMTGVKALLLVNNSNNLEVDTKFYPKEEGGGPLVPVAVVTSDTGEILKKCITKHDRNVEVRVEILSKEKKSILSPYSSVFPGTYVS